MNVRTTARRLAPVLPMLLAAVLAACGGDDESAPAANGMDLMFATEMVPHHESAVEMAEIARERSERREIQDLAEGIIETQNAEIRTLNDLAARFEDAGVEEGHEGMQMGEMDMGGDTAMLRTAKPFDRAFIDMMIPHHQSAITMAQDELESGQSPEAKKLAREIIDAQTREIEQLNAWRVDWYGEPSPAGGAPAQ